MHSDAVRSEALVQLENMDVEKGAVVGAAIRARPDQATQGFSVDTGTLADDFKDAPLEWRQAQGWNFRLITGGTGRHGGALASDAGVGLHDLSAKTFRVA